MVSNAENLGWTSLSPVNLNPSQEGSNPQVTFNDLLYYRTGGIAFTEGNVPSTITQVTSVEQWQAKAKALRNIFEQTLGEQPDVECSLDSEILKEVDRGDYLERKIAYNVEPDERITAYLLLPKKLSHKVPAIVCIPPTVNIGKEQTAGHEESEGGQIRAYGLHLVKRGYITLSYDLYNSGERYVPGTTHYDTAPFYKRHPKWSMRGKDIWDCGRAIDYLLTLDKVDPHRIGAVGHSLGACIAIHAAAVDTRIGATLSNSGWYPSRLSKNTYIHARTTWWSDAPQLQPFAVTGKLFPIDLHEQIALIAPRAVMLIHPLNDEQYTVEEVDFTQPAFENLIQNVTHVYSLFKENNKYRHILHPNGHRHFDELHTTGYDFFDEIFAK